MARGVRGWFRRKKGALVFTWLNSRTAEETASAHAEPNRAQKTHEKACINLEQI